MGSNEAGTMLQFPEISEALFFLPLGELQGKQPPQTFFYTIQITDSSTSSDTNNTNNNTNNSSSDDDEDEDDNDDDDDEDDDDRVGGAAAFGQSRQPGTTRPRPRLLQGRGLD
ncbi:hypothetical protein ACHAO4_009575 [Trichoderma viride]